MSLTKKISKCVGMIGIGLASILNEGCETSTDTALLGGLMGAMAASPSATYNQSQALSALSQGTFIASQNQARENSATRINVNVNAGQKKESKQLIQIYGCEWNDLNKNNEIEEKEKGKRKNYFTRNEDFGLIVDLYGYSDNVIRESLRDNEGNLLHEFKSHIPNNAVRVYMKFKEGEFNSGNYNFEVYLNEEFLINWPFNITE